MKRHWKVLVSIVLVTAIACAYPFQIYYVRDDGGGGQLLWNKDEACLFLQVVRRGYHVSYLEYPWALLTEWLGGVRRPTGQRVFVWVIHLTPSVNERHLAWVQDNPSGVPGSFTPVGHTIYTFCEGALCKWAGDSFVKANTDEQKQVGGIEHLGRDIDGPINGWTKRGVGSVSGDVQFSVEIGKELIIRVKQGNVYKSIRDTPIISLEHAGHSVEQLWHLDGAPRRVSRKEYERELSPRSTE